MWIYLHNAFVSIVAHRGHPDQVIVRGRAEGDVARFLDAGGIEAEIRCTPSADYCERTVISRTDLGRALACVAQTIAYDNFKSSVQDPGRGRVYFSVYASTARLARGSAF